MINLFRKVLSLFKLRRVTIEESLSNPVRKPLEEGFTDKAPNWLIALEAHNFLVRQGWIKDQDYYLPHKDAKIRYPLIKALETESERLTDLITTLKEAPASFDPKDPLSLEGILDQINKSVAFQLRKRS